MTTNINLFEKTLRKHNYSITFARQQVFDVLETYGPVSMNKLNQLTTVNRSSIYRTVYLFEQIGIGHRVYGGWKYTIELSDMFDSHHHHASCLHCGKIISLTDNDELEKAIEKLSKKYSFKVMMHQVELTGLCAKCQPVSQK